MKWVHPYVKGTIIEIKREREIGYENYLEIKVESTYDLMENPA